MSANLYCKILLSVRGLLDKNSASYYYFTSNVMYKWYERLVYTHPDLLARFCKVNLSNAKNSCLILFPGLINLRRSRAIMALKCDRSLLPVFGCTYEAINSMLDLVHSLSNTIFLHGAAFHFQYGTSRYKGFIL